MFKGVRVCVCARAYMRVFLSSIVEGAMLSNYSFYILLLPHIIDRWTGQDERRRKETTATL